MYCSECKRYTDLKHCPECGSLTDEEAAHVVFWCDHCRIPIIGSIVHKHVTCPLCNGDAPYLCTDLRPVFPEERLLFEVISAEPFAYAEDSVWATGSKYYINGKPVSLSVETIEGVDAEKTRLALAELSSKNSYESFDSSIALFVKANKEHLKDIVNEACSFVVDAARDYPEESLVVSFSGGKDSTVTADLAVRALSDPYLVHIYGDTTLEFPTTGEYAKRFREEHPLAIFKVAKNESQDFYSMAETIGPPGRVMRWCCSTFKTGPITKAFRSMYGNEKVLTFYGIRKGESVARSKYSRVEDAAESVKIQQQSVAAPIFPWNDIDVWLYILSEGLDFNEAYRFGYERVGCWCCPNNNPRAELLSRIYMPEHSKRWRDFLIDFAISVGKPDPEVYVDKGMWKMRQGGNGVDASTTVKLETKRCATEDNAMVYELERPYTDVLPMLMTPIGVEEQGLGRQLLEERVFVDKESKMPLFSIMPFEQPGYDYCAKVRFLGDGDQSQVQRMVKYQVLKYNACQQCLKCESLCRFGAITINGGKYKIDEQKCTRCKQCVTDKYLEGGCLMRKYLRTKEA